MVVVAIYAVTATLCRNELALLFDDIDTDAMSGLDVLVTFMIIFYVSYCYDRYQKQFDDAEAIMRK